MVAYKEIHQNLVLAHAKGIRKKFPERTSDYLKKRVADYAESQMNAGHDVEANKSILAMYYGR